MQLSAAQLYVSSKEMTKWLKKKYMVGKPKGDGKEKIVVLLTLEISRESYEYLSQLSCSHMELVQTWHLREGTTESCQFRWSQVV